MVSITAFDHRRIENQYQSKATDPFLFSNHRSRHMQAVCVVTYSDIFVQSSQTVFVIVNDCGHVTTVGRDVT